MKEGSLHISKSELTENISDKSHSSSEFYIRKSESLKNEGTADQSLSNFLIGLNHYPESIALHKLFLRHCNQYHLFHLAIEEINICKTIFPDNIFFYQRELELYRKLTDFISLNKACSQYVEKFPADTFGLFHQIETLILLKKKEAAESIYKASGHLLPPKLRLRFLFHFNHYQLIETLCKEQASEPQDPLFWTTEKLYISIILNKPIEAINQILADLVNHPNFSENHLSLLLKSAFVDKQIEKQLINLIKNSSLPPHHNLKKHITAVAEIRTYSNPPKINILNKEKKVDLVYTWVDISDSRFREKFKKTNGFDPYQSKNQQHNHLRYLSYGEIKFSLLTAQKFFSEVNHIYIITNDQYFDLDFLSPSFRSKTSFVNQEDILPKEYISQPVFDSTLIETFIWNIPNLSETIVYCCDDYFFANYIDVNKHLIDEKNIPYATMKPQIPPNLEFVNNLLTYFGSTTKYQYYFLNAYEQYKQQYGSVPPMNDLHLPIILSKSACKKAFEDCKHIWINNFFKNTTRSIHSVNTLLTYTWYAIQHGYQVPGPYHYYKRNSMVFNSGLTAEGVKMIELKKPLFVCVNFLPDKQSQELFEHFSESYLHN